MTYPRVSCERCGTETKSSIRLCMACQGGNHVTRDFAPTDKYRHLLSPEARERLEQREREGWK